MRGKSTTKSGFDPDHGGLVSDTGLAHGHELKCCVIDQSWHESVGSSHSLFILKCVDIIDPEARDVCRVIVKNKREGKILISLEVVEKGEQLGEIVVILMAMVDRVLVEVVPDQKGGAAPLKTTLNGVNNLMVLSLGVVEEEEEVRSRQRRLLTFC